MWVRGLKHIGEIIATATTASHPMWVRGLKLIVQIGMVLRGQVAPYVGAWIETNNDQKKAFEYRRTLCGCVD